MNEYYYQKAEDGKVYRYRIERDEDPINPREDYVNASLCDMYIWWDGYSLGDNEGYGSPYDALAKLIEKYLPDVDYEDMTTNKMRMTLQSKAADKVKIYPIFVYEHSGITISMSNDYPYNDRWDAGCGGFIVAEKEAFDRCECNWDMAYEIAEAEVEEYDMYLCGECYGWIEDVYEGDGEWDEHEDSCWGYLSRKRGKELAEYILGELITEEEAEEACREYDRMEMQKAEYGLRMMAH